jgi:phosphomannomutase
MTLRDRLNHEPRPLGFGTSGRRGEVIHLTQLEIYINALAELEYLQTLPREQGGIVKGEEFYFAHDLRPSSTAFTSGDPPRGEISQAIEAAIRDAGMTPVHLGAIPTPALTCYAVARGKGSIMVTGSHIPFNRNGYKLNTSAGELLKEQEIPINAAVQDVRDRLYHAPFAESPFNERGLLKVGPHALAPESCEAAQAYLARYLDFFRPATLEGLKVLVYQHSAVGRDLLADLLRQFGAEVIPAGRSEDFVPIDTENINAAHLVNIQSIVDGADNSVSTVVSTDGDSDRPLLLAVIDGLVRFFPGDLLGMITAEYLAADAAVVPISCNDGIDRGPLAGVLEPKTKIGSPYVIAGMTKARDKGRERVCGWEANGGFLLGSDIERNGRTLRALATRDAMLPILCVLFAARQRGLSLPDLFARLPKRFSRSALLPDFPQAIGRKMVRQYSPETAPFEEIRSQLQQFMPPDLLLGTITALDHTDGVRMTFTTGDVLHFRPSGNADELRVYAVSDTEDRAALLAARCVAEPNGILRTIERAVV